MVQPQLLHESPLKLLVRINPGPLKVTCTLRRPASFHVKNRYSKALLSLDRHLRPFRPVHIFRVESSLRNMMSCDLRRTLRSIFTARSAPVDRLAHRQTRPKEPSPIFVSSTS